MDHIPLQLTLLNYWLNNQILEIVSIQKLKDLVTEIVIEQTLNDLVLEVVTIQ